MKIDLSEFDAALRIDLYTFVQCVHATLNPGAPFLENWHIEMMCAELQAFYRGERGHLLCNLPPRNIKSLTISVAFVAWVLGLDPRLRFMVVSYGQELAEKFARDTRTVMISAWYRRLFPRTRLAPTRTAAHDFDTTLGGGRMAASRGGPITGRGAHFVILDDPMKAEEAFSEAGREAAYNFVTNTLLSRPEDKTKGSIIVTMQRLHEDDVSGRLLKSGRWRHICVPAIAQADEVWRYQTPWGPRVIRRASGEALHPKREPLEALEDLRAMLGEQNFSAQYLQNPIPMRGNIVPIEKFGRYEAGELPASFNETLFSVDTAVKATDAAHFTVITHWGRKGRAIYLLNVWRIKLSYFELKVRLRALAKDLKPLRILIEDTPGSQPLIQEFTNEGLPGVTGRRPKGDKSTRMNQAAILIEAGDVYLPSSAPWLTTYLHELAAFPHSTYDDQADSTSQALNWFREQRYEPGFLRYIHEEREQRIQKQNEKVPMRAPPGLTSARGIEGDLYRPDGVTRLAWVRSIDIVPLLNSGWVKVEQE